MRPPVVRKRKRTTSRPAPRAPAPAAAVQPESIRARYGILTALGSGLCWPLACADFDIWPLAWVAMAPLFLLCERTRSRKRALLYGWLAGTVANAGGFYWIAGMLERFGNMPMPVAWLATIAVAAYQGLPFLLLIAVARFVRGAYPNTPMALIAPLAMAGFETLWPNIFPFYLAITQAWVLPIIQIADLTGPVGVTALLMMSGGAIFDVVTSSARPRRIRIAATSFGIIALCLGYGFLRIHQTDARREVAEKLKVGLVQPNVAFGKKGGDPKAELEILQTESQKLEGRGAELVVWPETSFPFALPRLGLKEDLPKDSENHIRKGLTKPTIVGAVTEDELDKSKHPYNSAVFFDANGKVAGLYDKIFLLIFGEYTPGADTFEFIRNLIPQNAGLFTRGAGVTTFPLEHRGKTYRLGPMICYEDILADFGRKLGKLHPHLFVNLTNDAWFGETSEPWEHMALSVYRAVEHRIDLVRAVNTGVSTFIDASGRVFAKTYAVDPARRAVPADGLLGEVALLEGGNTVYARVGDVFGWGSVLFILVACIGARRRKDQAV